MINGFKYYKFNKELFNSGYFTELTCNFCKKSDVNVEIKFPYRIADVCYTCKSCNSAVYYDVIDVMRYYTIYNILNRLVGINLKPGEIKEVSELYENIVLADHNKIVKRNRYILGTTIFIIGYLLWFFLG